MAFQMGSKGSEEGRDCMWAGEDGWGQTAVRLV